MEGKRYRTLTISTGKRLNGGRCNSKKSGQLEDLHGEALPAVMGEDTEGYELSSNKLWRIILTCVTSVGRR